jgi:hypothetical protein
VGFVGLIVTPPAAVLCHELGHVAGTLAVGFRVRQFNVLGVHLDLDARRLRWARERLKNDVMGYVLATAPLPGRLRGRMATFLAAGPLVTLLCAALAAFLAWHWQAPLGWRAPPGLRGAWWQAFVLPGSAWVGVCNQIAGFSLYLLAEGLLPCAGKGGRNDSLMILDCVRDRPGTFRLMAFLAVLESMRQGVRPRDWEPAWTALLDGPADGSTMQGLADVVGYYHAEDCGRHDEAGRLLDRARGALAQMEGNFRRGLCLETAYYVAFHRGNADEGRQWLSRISREGVEDHTWLRAEAALLGAEGKYTEALALIAAALEAVPRSKDRGGSIAERDWLERMRSRYSQSSGCVEQVVHTGGATP